MFFNDWLSRRSLYTPDRGAVGGDKYGGGYTFWELTSRASRLANYLKAPLGVRPGDRVACLSTNRVEYLDLYFACGKMGAQLVPLNVRFPAGGIVELLEDCRGGRVLYRS